MQGNDMTIRGYVPQTTRAVTTDMYQRPSGLMARLRSTWQMLDPAAVALLVAAVLGLGYALFATISFWWLTKLIPHLVLAWVSLICNATGMFSYNRSLMLLSGLIYVAAALLFVNYAYLLLPQVILCLVAWAKAK